MPQRSLVLIHIFHLRIVPVSGSSVDLFITLWSERLLLLLLLLLLDLRRLLGELLKLSIDVKLVLLELVILLLGLLLLTDRHLVGVKPSAEGASVIYLRCVVRKIDGIIAPKVRLLAHPFNHLVHSSELMVT